MDYKCDLCNQNESIVGNLITGRNKEVDYQICKDCIKTYKLDNPDTIIIMILKKNYQQYKQQIDKLEKWLEKEKDNVRNNHEFSNWEPIYNLCNEVLSKLKEND